MGLGFGVLAGWQPSESLLGCASRSGAGRRRGSEPCIPGRQPPARPTDEALPIERECDKGRRAPWHSLASLGRCTRLARSVAASSARDAARASPRGRASSRRDPMRIKTRTRGGSRLTVHYSMTRSARAKSEGGIVRPRVLAVLRLMNSSNLVGRSTGRSPGLMPLRILST